jgi:type IV pilus assembly protein PilB
MIGEIRDGETAEIAVKAAITGHLVLSTIHTNDAPSTVNRLVDMGIEPFMLSSSLVGVIAQRLVRRVCNSCKHEYVPSEEEMKTLGITDPNFKLYKGTGCKDCNNTGYRGRIAIHEILVINKEVREAISKRLPTDALKDICIHHGMKTLKDSGFQLVKKGVTTLQEVFGVAYDNEDSNV